MIEEILNVYRYMPADERIKGMRLYNSYEFPYLDENKIRNIFIRYLVKYLIEVCTSYRVMFECVNMNDKFVFDGYDECFKKYIKKEIQKNEKEILESIRLLEKIDLPIDRESIALVSAIKRIGREIKRPMKITVEPLFNGKLIKINDIDMVYLRGGLYKTLHDVLKDLSRMLVGDTDFIY